MEVPVLRVVDVVDAEGGGPVAADLPAHAQVDGEVAAGAEVGVGVDVAVVEVGVLAAAVARGDGEGPALVGPPGRMDGGAPARHARLPPADAGGVVGVGDGLRVGVGEAAAQVQPAHPHVAAGVGQLDAGGAHLVHVLHARDGGV